MIWLRVSILIFIICGTIQAQEWFPVGATWHYSQIHFWPSMETSTQFEVVGEIEIQGKSCKLIEGVCNCAPPGGNIVCHEGDIIYRYDTEMDSFSILYDFSLQPGDTITLRIDGFDPTYYRLESLSQMILNGIPIRVQHLSWLDGNSVAIGLTNYEFIGNDGCFYPQVGFCDPLTGGLRCYEDSIFGLQKFYGFNLDCEAIISSSDNTTFPGISFYPNPAHDYLIIGSTTPITKIELLDVHGRTVLSEEQGSPVLDLGKIPSGLYVVRLSFPDQAAFLSQLAVIH